MALPACARACRTVGRLRLRRLDPMAPALERIARHRDTAPRLSREEPGKRDREPRFVGAGHRVHKPGIAVRCGAVGRPRTRQNDRPASAVPGLLGAARGIRPVGGDRRAGRPARTDLHNQPHSPLRQRSDALPVRGRLAQMSKSERRLKHLFGPRHPARDAAHQRNDRWLGHNSRERRIDIVCRSGGFRRFPRHGQTEPFFEAQYPGRMCRRQLAHAEPGDHARAHSHARPQRGERTLERIERRVVERSLRSGFA